MNSQTTSHQTASATKPSQSTSARPSLCCYTNTTSHVQIIRLVNQSHTNWQRVVFPGERLMFEAGYDSNLEIQVSEGIASLVNCKKLLVRLST